MKSLLYTTAVAVLALPVLTTGQNCSPTDDFCPACNGNNVTDTSGFEYVITCDYAILAGSEVQVNGQDSPAACMDACDETDGCLGVNIASNGSCTLAQAPFHGMSRSPGFTNLLLQSGSASATSSASGVQITSTVNGPGITSASPSTTSIVPVTSPSSTTECNLNSTDLCPHCNKQDVTGKDNRLYRIFCDNDLHSSNGTFSVQEWTSPEGCLEACADFSLCKGASYYADRDCEFAKGDEIYPTPAINYTAFLPISSTSATVIVSIPHTTSTVTISESHTTTETTTITPLTTAETTTGTPLTPAAFTPTMSIPTTSASPGNASCDFTALSCPACRGHTYTDQLNNSYTVRCSLKPVCSQLVEGPQGGNSPEQCLQKCDQDATCLAILWYPATKKCSLCQDGLDEHYGKGAPYIVLVAKPGGHNVETTSSTGLPLATPPLNHTVSSSTFTSITEFPRPFQTVTTTTTTRPTTRRTTSTSASGRAVGPVGPVSLTSLSIDSSSSHPLSSHTISSRRSSSGMSIFTSSSSVVHHTTSAPHIAYTNIGTVSCPAYNDDIYIDSENGNFFDVQCDTTLEAAYATYVSASDFTACAASCTGSCDGVQFGSSTRCGLYTEITGDGPGAGWTAAAIITGPGQDPVTPAAPMSTNGPSSYSVTTSFRYLNTTTSTAGSS